MNIKIKDILMINPDHTTQVANIFVVGDKIAHIGINAPRDFRCDYLIDGRDKLAVPGFINTHTHSYLSLFRNWLDAVPSDMWNNKLYEVVSRLTPEDAYPACLLSLLEMIQSGTTSFVDMQVFPEATITAATDVSMTAVVSRKLTNITDEGTRLLQEAIEEYERFRDNKHVHFLLAPDYLFNCDTEFLKKVVAVADKYSLGLHTHVVHHHQDVAACIRKYFKSPVDHLNDCGFLTPKTILAGSSYLVGRDIDLLSKNKVNLSLTTTSNLKYKKELPSLIDLGGTGINLCLGTDGAVFNNQNMLEEMKITALSNKWNDNFTCVDVAHEVFDMATIKGAKAIGQEDHMGQLTRGYNADIAIFDLNDLPLVPLHDPIAALVYSSAGLTAHTVICNGNIMLHEKDFVNIDTFKLKDHILQVITDKVYELHDKYTYLL